LLLATVQWPGSHERGLTRDAKTRKVVYMLTPFLRIRVSEC
jgi:hypothetical protein